MRYNGDVGVDKLLQMRQIKVGSSNFANQALLLEFCQVQGNVHVPLNIVVTPKELNQWNFWDLKSFASLQSMM
jgi:hypothetical protein